MKFSKIFGLLLILLALAPAAFAQRGLDAYGVPRTLVLLPPVLVSGGAAGTQTGVWMDVKSFDGIANLNIVCQTNVGNSSFTYTVQGSNDGTNATTIANASIASATTVVYTNGYYGYTTNVSVQLYATNVYNLPGVIVNPTASTAGWATPYLNTLANPFTNSLSAVTPAYGFTTIGINIADAPRYLRVIVTPGGAATNGFCGATLLGFTHSTGWPF